VGKVKARLSEATVTKCLEALDWPALQKHLSSFELDEEAGARLVGLVLRARSFVFRYPGNTKKRHAVLEGVVAKVRTDLGDDAAEGAATRLAIFQLIDEGYAGLRELIDALPLATLSQAKQVSAYLGRAARDWADVRTRVAAAGATGTAIISGVMLETDDGYRYGAAAATSLFVNLLGMNVVLAAFRERWFDGEGIIRLPELPVPSEEQVSLAASGNLTAVAWQQWQLIEERCRYLGGELRKRPAIEGDGLPVGSQIIEHVPDGVEWELLDTVANERLGERLTQTFQQMCLKTNILTVGCGVEPGAAMPPSGYVSPEEMHSAVMLSEFLGLNAATHATDLGGLRLSEWLRGFAVLQRLVNDGIEAADDPRDAAFPRWEIPSLEAVLQRNGLEGSRARVFIDHASFARSSRDIYDAPILRGKGDWCLLAAPALSEALLIRLVLSTLANKELDIAGKGEAFEAQFRALFRSRGLPVYSFEVRRGGQTYEFDAIVPWGSYLFVFECKNRSLSGTNPIASYNLLRASAANVDQVRRLVDALHTYPDILEQLIQEDCASLQIVPVVVNSMPFSLPGDLGGVHFSDAGAISRFFEERYVHVSRLHPLGEAKILHRVAIEDLWSADEPDAEAFIRHLKDPLPVRVMRAHMRVEPFGIQIGPALYTSTEIPRRQEMTMESIAAASGLSGESIQAEMEAFASVLEAKRAEMDSIKGGKEP